LGPPGCSLCKALYGSFADIQFRLHLCNALELSLLIMDQLIEEHGPVVESFDEPIKLLAPHIHTTPFRDVPNHTCRLRGHEEKCNCSSVHGFDLLVRQYQREVQRP
jgi:hypothetical protein